MYSTRKILLLTAFVLFTLSLHSQTDYFNNLYDDPFSLANSGSSVIIKNGNFIVGGTGSRSCDTSTIDIFSIDNYGNLEWVKSYNYANYITFTPQTSQLITTPDSGYIFFRGTTFSCQWPTFSTSKLLKLDANGDSLWSKSIGGNGGKIRLTSDNGIFIASSSSGCLGNVCWSDLLLVKLDNMGNVIWDTIYGDAVKIESAVSAELTTDGGYIIFGFISDSANANSSNLYLFKVDSIGNFQWDKRITGTENIGIYGSLKLVEDDYIIYGGRYDSIINDRQGYIAKIDTSGNMIWEKSYGGPNFESIYKIRELPDGSFISIGSEWITPDASNAFLMKFNSSWDSLWSQTFSKADSANNSFYDVQPTQDGGFIITGNAIGDMWLVKTDSLGKVAGIEHDWQIADNELRVYPNPFSTETVITFNASVTTDFIQAGKGGSVLFTLYDILGKKQNIQYALNKLSIKLMRGDLNNGVYFYKISINENFINVGKLIVE